MMKHLHWIRRRPLPARRVAPLLLRRGMATLASAAALTLVLAAMAGAQPPRDRALSYPPLDPQTRGAIIDSIAQALDREYVFADVAEKMEKRLRERLRRGEYDALQSLPDFTQELTRDLQSISHDKHLHVGPIPPDRPESTPGITPEEMQKRQMAEAARRNFGFQSVQLLPGNIGYIELHQFYDATIGGPTAIAAMNLLSHVDALIFDLRHNGGGDPTMIQLLSSYLFDRPTHLNSFWIRQDDSTQQFWTYASVPGPRLTNVPVYVLTSSRTFSGAEEFSYNLKNLKRGTIIGEVTGGGAHPVNRHVFEKEHVAAMIPFGRAVNPITKTNWEGVGVEPDIKVPADSALAVAQVEALKKLREQTEDPEARRSYDWVLSGMEARARHLTLEPSILQAYSGIYGPRRVSVEGSTLYYQRESRPRMRLIPAGEDLFLVDKADFFRIRFSRDGSGRIDRLIGMYDDGTSDENARTGDAAASGS